MFKARLEKPLKYLIANKTITPERIVMCLKAYGIIRDDVDNIVKDIPQGVDSVSMELSDNQRQHLNDFIEQRLLKIIEKMKPHQQVRFCEALTKELDFLMRERNSNYKGNYSSEETNVELDVDFDEEQRSCKAISDLDWNKIAKGLRSANLFKGLQDLCNMYINDPGITSRLSKAKLQELIAFKESIQVDITFCESGPIPPKADAYGDLLWSKIEALKAYLPDEKKYSNKNIMSQVNTLASIDNKTKERPTIISKTYLTPKAAIKQRDTFSPYITASQKAEFEAIQECNDFSKTQGLPAWFVVLNNFEQKRYKIIIDKMKFEQVGNSENLFKMTPAFNVTSTTRHTHLAGNFGMHESAIYMGRNNPGTEKSPFIIWRGGVECPIDSTLEITSAEYRLIVRENLIQEIDNMIHNYRATHNNQEPPVILLQSLLSPKAIPEILLNMFTHDKEYTWQQIALEELDKIREDNLYKNTRIHTTLHSIDKYRKDHDAFASRLRGSIDKPHKKILSDAKDLIGLHEELGKNVTLREQFTYYSRKEGKQEYNLEIHKAALECLLIDDMGGITKTGCRSGKDRTGYLLTYLDALRSFQAIHKTYPDMENPESRKLFNSLFVTLLLERHHPAVAGQNTPGADALKAQEVLTTEVRNMLEEKDPDYVKSLKLADLNQVPSDKSAKHGSHMATVPSGFLCKHFETSNYVPLAPFLQSINSKACPSLDSQLELLAKELMAHLVHHQRTISEREIDALVQDIDKFTSDAHLTPEQHGTHLKPSLDKLGELKHKRLETNDSSGLQVSQNDCTRKDTGNSKTTSPVTHESGTNTSSNKTSMPNLENQTRPRSGRSPYN